MNPFTENQRIGQFYPGASLALDFVRGRYRGPTGGAVSTPEQISGWSFTRTGAGTA